MLRIRKPKPNSYLFDNEIELIFLEKLIDRIRFLTARINPPWSIQQRSQEPVKQIL